MDLVKLEAFSFLKQEITCRIILEADRQHRSPLSRGVIDHMINQFGYLAPWLISASVCWSSGSPLMSTSPNCEVSGSPAFVTPHYFNSTGCLGTHPCGRQCSCPWPSTRCWRTHIWRSTPGTPAPKRPLRQERRCGCASVGSCQQCHDGPWRQTVWLQQSNGLIHGLKVCWQEQTSQC